MWNTNVKPTRENVLRRLHAAIDALDAADLLIKQMPNQPGLAEVRNAKSWAGTATNLHGGKATQRRRVH